MIPDIQKLTVLYRDIPAGTLQLDPSSGACVFEYDKSWLTNGFSLSPTELPLQAGLFMADKNKFNGNFATFHDSLPDGYGLYLLQRILKKQGSSLYQLTPLQLLSIIGNSSMGALTYVPAMKEFQMQKEVENDEILNDLQDRALAVLSEKETGDESLLYYNSANSGGARPKVAYKSNKGTHWIIKFRHTFDDPDIGKQELKYMTTARKCGITIPRVGLIKDRYFAIERFDISPNGQRLHVLTAAALLKTNFREQSADYTNLLALTGYLTQNPIQVEEMFRRMVANIVINNKDDHAKNFSFICKDGLWELAPAYDITYSPKGSNGEHATSLFFNGNPSLELVLQAGEQIYIKKERCLEILHKVEKACMENLDIDTLKLLTSPNKTKRTDSFVEDYWRKNK